ncbi:RagB/SusD family nutrient uptake outer membrane protein [Limibacter armeniacum]|uniref:RagB/SusD family nutrient uptake outer membrane protein n=1 Tax=Limibacter armeniacum TaxID=466084 RepID=UPI002FE6C08A
MEVQLPRYFDCQPVNQQCRWRGPTRVLDKNLQKRVVAEAKFVRAYYYYDLVKNFGGVPLVKQALALDEMTFERADAKEVYAFIEEDLKAAVEDLPLKSQMEIAEQVGRATKGAALAMLVKVSASQASEGYSRQSFYDPNKWADAKEYAEQLFALGKYSLYMGDYHDIFTEAGENGPGSIFEIQYYDSPLNDGATTDNGNFNTFLNNTWFGGADPYGKHGVTYDAYLAFEDGDPRREASIINIVKYADQWGEDPEDAFTLTGFANYKHYISKEEYQALGNQRNSPINERIIRLSDIYLLYAEASYHTGDEATALQYVNMVRERARGAGTIPADISSTGTALLEDIYLERRRELVSEGHRWHDLVRTGRLDELNADGYKVKASITRDGVGGYIVTDSGDPIFKPTNLAPTTHIYFPIPISEIDNSGGVITPNPGY